MHLINLDSRARNDRHVFCRVLSFSSFALVEVSILIHSNTSSEMRECGSLPLEVRKGLDRFIRLDFSLFICLRAQSKASLTEQQLTHIRPTSFHLVALTGWWFFTPCFSRLLSSAAYPSFSHERRLIAGGPCREYNYVDQGDCGIELKKFQHHEPPSHLLLVLLDQLQKIC